MREIANRQESEVRNDRKRFHIVWAEKMDRIAEVKAKTKKEALELFCKDDDQIWASLECCQSETARKPSVKEVKE